MFNEQELKIIEEALKVYVISLHEGVSPLNKELDTLIKDAEHRTATLAVIRAMFRKLQPCCVPYEKAKPVDCGAEDPNIRCRAMECVRCAAKPNPKYKPGPQEAQKKVYNHFIPCDDKIKHAVSIHCQCKPIIEGHTVYHQASLYSFGGTCYVGTSKE